jgi:hypothetical protein
MSETAIIAIFIGVIAVIALVILAARPHRGTHDLAARVDATLRDADREMARVGQMCFEKASSPNQLMKCNEDVRGFVLEDGEDCFLFIEDVGWIVTAKDREFHGIGQSVSVPVAHGIRYRIGDFSGRADETLSEVLGDYGSLALTDRRLVFAGQRRIISIEFPEIGDIRTDAQRLRILYLNKENPEEFAFTIAEWPPVVRAGWLFFVRQDGPGRHG